LTREKSSPYKSVSQDESSFSARGKSSLYKYYGYKDTIQERNINKDTPREKTVLNKGTGLIYSIMEYIRPLNNLFGYFWNNFTPLRWFIYTLLTFCSFPTAILIGWVVLCFSVIIALAGIGITIAEGFFIFLGMSIFLPVAIILCIVAFVIVLFFTLAWLGMRSSVAVYEYFNKPSDVEVEEITESTKRSIIEESKFDL
jgi:hypothetical protein